MSVADWILATKGVDPAADYRGTYASEEEFDRIVRREGGLVPLFDRLLAGVGMLRTDTPDAGDVGVVERPVNAAGAIRTASGKWAMLYPRGLVIRPAPTIAAWCWP